jgi:uroporphyrinogen-III synthase
MQVTLNPEPASLAKPSAMVVTSGNAVRALARWPTVASWEGLPAYGLGSTAGITEVIPGITVGIAIGDGRGLAEKIAAEIPVGRGEILYAAGRDRASDLEALLTAARYNLRVVEAYRVDPVPEFPRGAVVALAAGDIDGVLLYSRRSAETWLRLAAAAGITAALGRLETYVISDNVADIVRDVCPRVHVAAIPNEDNLLALIPARA